MIIYIVILIFIDNSCKIIHKSVYLEMLISEPINAIGSTPLLVRAA